MPAFVTHVFFGDLVYQNLQGEAQNCASSYPAAFFWGLQGPDLLFFRDAVRGKSSLPAVGGVMHREKTGELFAAMAQYIEACPEQEQQLLTAYFMGFLCHYYMDATAHPYIYFLQEQKKKHTPPAEQKGIHNLIESDIDTAVHRLFAKKSVRKYRISKELQGTEPMYRAIARLYCHVLGQVYGIGVQEEDVAQCFTDTLWIIGALLEPTGLLLPVVQLAERCITGKPNTMSAHIRRSRTYEDILNQRKKFWHCLATPEKQENLSFLELTQIAKDKAVCGVEEWFNRIQRGEAPVILGLPSFDCGAPAGEFKQQGS